MLFQLKVQKSNLLETEFCYFSFVLIHVAISITCKMFFEICFEVTIPTVQGIRFFPRIIVLTDGIATPETVTGCADFNPDMIERLKVDKRRQTYFL